MQIENLSTVALVMLARDDASGLRRAVTSVLGYIDELVIGVDARSGDATWIEANELRAKVGAGEVYRFEAKDIGMTDEAWEANKIHFANARNFGNAKAKSAWILILDTDEHVVDGADRIRDLVRDVTRGAYLCSVVISTVAQKSIRLARRDVFSWDGGTHNQLLCWGESGDGGAIRIEQDVSIRDPAYQQRRNQQRDEAVLALREDAEKGDMSALFHLAKHLLCADTEVARDAEARFEEGRRLAEEYRARGFPHGDYRDERFWLALGIGMNYYNREDYANAEVWAIRALLDGPRVEPMCLLGDIAEEEKRLGEALGWYEAACVLPRITSSLSLPELSMYRHGRLAGLRKVLGRNGPEFDAPKPSPVDAPVSSGAVESLLRDRLAAVVAEWRVLAVSKPKGVTPDRVFEQCAALIEGLVQQTTAESEDGDE